MKKSLAILMALLMVLTLPLMALPFAVLAEGEAVAGPILSWTEIFTQGVIWLISAVAGIVFFFIWKWLYPMLRDTVIPWLKDRNLMIIAEAAVKYAEAVLGRYNGDKKWMIALDWLRKKGWNIDSEAVLAALKSAWYSLNLDQIKAGIKAPEQEQKPPDDAPS